MCYLGIDIAKAKFDASLLQGNRYKHKCFDNNQQGFQKLISWLSPQDDCHVCMEATGSYGFALARCLSERGFKVSIVNPAKIKGFATSELSRNKTDKLDAALIARFCKEKTPRLWLPPSEQEENFQALYRRLDSLKGMKAQELTRLSSERCEQVRSSIEAHIAYLDEQLDAIEAALDLIVFEHERLTCQAELLQSIPGVGKTTAYFLLAEINFEQFEHVNQLVAFAGLNPKKHNSGSFTGKSPISKMGSSRIRKALYFPAITATKFNPLIASLAQRLELKGHCKLSIICAAMRKLLHLAFGLIKNNSPFDPNFLQRA